MIATKIASAVALGAALVSAQRDTCTRDIEITENNPVIDCTTVDADITIDSSVTGTVFIEGPEEVLGSIRVSNASDLNGIVSTTLESINTLEIDGLPLLSTLDLQNLRSLNTLTLIHLNLLQGLTFGTTGVTSATTVTISDTGIEDLSGLNLATVQDFYINNNDDLQSFNSDLVNITGELIIVDNAPSMDINMTSLEMASEIQLANVQSFNVPALAMVEQSLKFDNNPELKSFEANNLTEIGASLTFQKNDKLTNLSFDALTMVGDMTIQNNTELTELTGFPELETVGGALLLGGSFETVELPAIRNIRGTITITSTTDISDFCDSFQDIEDTTDAETSCTSNNADANEDPENGGGEDDPESSGDDEDEDGDSAAAGLSANLAMVSIAAVVGLAQLL